MSFIYTHSSVATEPGPRLSIKTAFPRYGDSNVKDKTVARPSYLKHGDPYTGKMTSLYWDGPQSASHVITPVSGQSFTLKDGGEVDSHYITPAPVCNQSH